MERKEFLWVEKFRPRKVEDCILPKRIKKQFVGFVKSGSFPHLLLAGLPGSGKTTAARALCEELDYDVLFINASKESGIDTVRNTIESYAATTSLTGSKKAIILDEADYLNRNSSQPALRQLIDRYQGNCTFIFTCNYRSMILEPLQSRCTVIDFAIPLEERKEVLQSLISTLGKILVEEKVKFEPKAVLEAAKKHFPDHKQYPDIRKTIQELQTYQQGNEGAIDVGILAHTLQEFDSKGMLEAVRSKNMTKIREWVFTLTDVDPSRIYTQTFEALQDELKPKSLCEAILAIGKYMYQAAFVADQHLNYLCCVLEICSDAEFHE